MNPLAQYWERGLGVRASPPHRKEPPMPAVLYDRFESVAVITLNRPEALNSLNEELSTDLYAAWEQFMADDEALVAVLTGAGRAFCAGMDMKAAAESARTGQPLRMKPGY